MPVLSFHIISCVEAEDRLRLYGIRSKPFKESDDQTRARSEFFAAKDTFTYCSLFHLKLTVTKEAKVSDKLNTHYLSIVNKY